MITKSCFKFVEKATSTFTSNPCYNANSDSGAIQVSGTFTSAVVKVQGKADLENGDWIDLALLDLGSTDILTQVTKKGIFAVMGVDVVKAIQVVVVSVAGGNISVFGNFVNTGE